MFSLCLDTAPTASRWQQQGLRYHGARGHIEILDHPLVSSKALSCDDRLGISIIQQPGRPQALRQCRPAPAGGPVPTTDPLSWETLKQQTAQWPLHWFWIEVEHDKVLI